MNYKRYRSRRKVRCTMCTDARDGNSKKSNPPRGRNRRNEARVREARRFDPQMELLSEKYDRQMLEWMEAEATGEWG